VLTRHVALIGLMGVGKTTVGRRLAKELDAPFVDTDEAVELEAGATIRTIFATDGEQAFRDLERRVTCALLARQAAMVLAAGGGAVIDDQTRAVLAERAYVVWLRADAAFLAARTDPTHRPLLAEDPVAALERLATERRDLYESVADVAVDVEPFHASDARPKRALARHIADLARAAGVVT
jgi:shikimate kinase